MAARRETVLYYNPGRPETMKHVAMMKAVMVRMGIRIRNVGPEQVGELVGRLAGLEEFTGDFAEAADAAGLEAGADRPGSDAAGLEVGAAGSGVGAADSASDAAGSGASGEGENSAAMTEEMLVLKGFSGRRLEELLGNLRRAGVPKINLKAMLTEHNCKWTFAHLYREISEEHQLMTEQLGGGKSAAAAGSSKENDR